MPALQRTDDMYEVYHSDRRIGSLHLYNNPQHTRNCYVKLGLDELNPEISAELFKQLHENVNRPLQIMASSDDAELIAFLLSGGFVCQRKCYEVKAGKDDYIGGQGEVPIMHCHRGDPDYEKACQMMFDHYTATHKAVNPYTADFDTFCNELPEDVICAKRGGDVVSLAFVEENEIAYVCGVDEKEFTEFACSLVSTLFEKYETLCFESDDCDWAAMLLKSMFANQDDASFDAYIYTRD